MHSSRRTIDDMMYISDNCDPHHYIKGRGIIGRGPMFETAEGELYDEAFDLLKPSRNERTNFKKIDTVLKDVFNTDEKRLYWLVKQAKDLDEIIDRNNRATTYEYDSDEDDLVEKKTPNEYIATKAKNMRSYIDDLINKKKYEYLEEPEIERLQKDISGLVRYYNPLYEANYNEAKDYIETNKKEIEKMEESKRPTIETKIGDYSEDKNINNEEFTNQFFNIDRDRSKIHNSKDFTIYNPDYLDKVSPSYEPKNAKEIKDWQKYVLDNLQYFPVDAVKIDNPVQGTIWELKSLSGNLDDPNGKQIMNGIGKITGRGKYEIEYMNDNKGIPVIKNIYYMHNKGKKNEEKIPTLPEKPQGYKYLWAFDNIDRVGYMNPLKSEYFIKEPIKGTKTFRGDWKRRVPTGNPNLQDKIEVLNKEIKVYPSTYVKEFHKKINK